MLHESASWGQVLATLIGTANSCSSIYPPGRGRGLGRGRGRLLVWLYFCLGLFEQKSFHCWTMVYVLMHGRGFIIIIFPWAFQMVNLFILVKVQILVFCLTGWIWSWVEQYKKMAFSKICHNLVGFTFWLLFCEMHVVKCDILFLEFKLIDFHAFRNLHLEF